MILRSPSGAVLLDTADRMPAETGTLETQVVAQYPVPAAEYVESRIVSGPSIEYRYVHTGAEETYTVDLGPAPTDHVPNYLLTRIKLSKAEGQTIFAHVYTLTLPPQGEWMQLNSGSLWVEHIRTSNVNQYIGNRTMYVTIEAGRWVLKLTHSSATYVSNWTWSGAVSGTWSSKATYTVDIALSWGVFDL